MSEPQPLLAVGLPDYRRPLVKPRKRPVLTRDDYPESDGKPVGETPLHVLVTFRLFGALLLAYKGRDDVIVGCDQLMYYEPDNIKKFLVPDIFVVLGVKPRPEAERQTWRIWEEGGYGPDFVLEVTSKSTRKHDEGRKHRIYEEIGVREYWQYDPTADYLTPELKGHRLVSGGKFEPVELEQRGRLLVAPSLLGLELHLQDGELRLFDPNSGYLPTQEEAVEARQAAEQAQRKAEQAYLEAERKHRESERAHQESERAHQESERAHREADDARRVAEARVAELERQLRGE